MENSDHIKAVFLLKYLKSTCTYELHTFCKKSINGHELIKKSKINPITCSRALCTIRCLFVI